MRVHILQSYVNIFYEYRYLPESSDKYSAQRNVPFLVSSLKLFNSLAI